MATTVIAVDTGEDAHYYQSALKLLWEKSLDSATSHPLPTALFIQPSHEGPSLMWDSLVLEIPHIPHIAKCTRRELPSTLPGTSPGSLEVHERVPSRCITPTPFHCDPRTPHL